MDDSKILDEIENLKKIKEELKNEIIELDEKLLFDGFGVYEPIFNYDTSDEYKEKLVQIKKQQKELIKKQEAAKCYNEWVVHGSIEYGKKMTLENIKQIIRNFNFECDLYISKVRFSNYMKIKEKIFKSFETLNEMNNSNGVYITEKYYRLKLKQLDLEFEYAKKKEEEKEERRRLKEELKEAEKVAREIEEKRKELDKEAEHYRIQLRKYNEQLILEKSEIKKKYILQKIDELDINVQRVNEAYLDLDYRESNQKAGYVYIISNIGSFGENIYKIGMTRRLEPEERIYELSGASVPFKYDIHALIFTDNAPKLEAELHKKFDKYKVNLVNKRKEFFNVTLDEIKKAVIECYDKTVKFIDIPEAQQYRETIMIKRNQ